MMRASAFVVLAGIALAYIAAPAHAVNKCQIPGAPPIYTDAPCPAGADVKTVETDIERDARLRKEAAAAKQRAAREQERVNSEEAAKRKAEWDKRLAKEKADMAAYAKEDREREANDPWGLAETRCQYGIREQMAYLEAVGPFTRAGKGYGKDDYKLRVAVRLSDSFRAEPVGVVECTVDVHTRRVYVTKVRQ